MLLLRKFNTRWLNLLRLKWTNLNLFFISFFIWSNKIKILFRGRIIIILNICFIAFISDSALSTYLLALREFFLIFIWRDLLAFFFFIKFNFWLWLLIIIFFFIIFGHFNLKFLHYVGIIVDNLDDHNPDIKFLGAPLKMNNIFFHFAV